METFVALYTLAALAGLVVSYAVYVAHSRRLRAAQAEFDRAVLRIMRPRYMAAFQAGVARPDPTEDERWRAEFERALAAEANGDR